MKGLQKCLLITVLHYIYNILAANNHHLQSSYKFTRAIGSFNLIIPYHTAKRKEWVWLKARTETLRQAENKTI